jgi:hypothetical protein
MITSYNLNDYVVCLDERFRIAGRIIFIDRPRLELVRADNLPKLGCQSVEHALA